jgi:hypothetical protein
VPLNHTAAVLTPAEAGSIGHHRSLLLLLLLQQQQQQLEQVSSKRVENGWSRNSSNTKSATNFHRLRRSQQRSEGIRTFMSKYHRLILPFSSSLSK